MIYWYIMAALISTASVQTPLSWIKQHLRWNLNRYLAQTVIMSCFLTWITWEKCSPVEAVMGHPRAGRPIIFKGGCYSIVLLTRPLPPQHWMCITSTRKEGLATWHGFWDTGWRLKMTNQISVVTCTIIPQNPVLIYILYYHAATDIC